MSVEKILPFQFDVLHAFGWTIEFLNFSLGSHHSWGFSRSPEEELIYGIPKFYSFLLNFYKHGSVDRRASSDLLYQVTEIQRPLNHAKSNDRSCIVIVNKL